MANSIVVQSSNHTRRRQFRRFVVTLTGSYVNGTGEVLDFTALTNPKFLSNPYPSFFSNLPAVTDWKVVRGPAGYTAEIIQNGSNTGLNNAFALKLFSAAGTELASGAYSAAVLADTVTIELLTSTWGG